MKIPIDVKVECSDGPAGHTAAIILDPAAKQVTHVVVKGKGTLVGEYLVPLDMIDQATPYSVILRLSHEKLAAAPRFDQTIIVGSAGDDGGLSPHPGVDSVNLGAASVPGYVQVEQVPGSGVAVHVGAHVDATDGRVGKVDEFVVNRDTGDIAYIILRHGHLWNKEEVCVPIANVDHIAEDIVYLNLDKTSVEALPVLPKY
jgi:sporulation protein YlmC with PRC-barrel domain